MIGVNFIGRLGNQLFQYHFLLYLKSQMKGKIFFFPNPHHAYLARYFDLGWYHNLTLNAKVYSVLMRIIPKILPFKDVYFQNFVAPKPIEIKDQSICQGYFQSDYYIQNNPNYKPVKIKPKYVSQFEEKYGDLFKSNKIITVHIRRTDYLNYGKRDISLPISHFGHQLAGIPNIDEYKVIFVSDDMEYVKAYFPAKSNFLFESNTEIVDFQLIQRADIAIISNSTFAWWAAILSPKPIRVIAPKNWMGFRIGREHPRGIMTDRFEWVEVRED